MPIGNQFDGISRTIVNVIVMKTVLHKAGTRGHANHGWLDSYHSFSFAGYYDPNRMGFGALRVLNDDTVAGGMGFGRHPHDNMEIVSIPLEGDLEHQDSTGRKEIIKQGDVQIMSAGTGIFHSEKNANHHLPVKFLQIWVLPKERGIAPRYGQATFLAEDRKGRFQTVVSPTHENALWINQDAWFNLIDLSPGEKATYVFNGQQKQGSFCAYVFVLNGDGQVAGLPLSGRDGLGISEATEFAIEAVLSLSVLIIEVPF